MAKRNKQRFHFAAPPEVQRENPCQSHNGDTKRAYFSRRDARDTVRSASKKYGYAITSYRCEDCGMIHLATKYGGTW